MKSKQKAKLDLAADEQKINIFRSNFFTPNVVKNITTTHLTVSEGIKREEYDYVPSDFANIRLFAAEELRYSS